jgi:basic amino acid/polyamine antiporter, APA family
VASTGMKWASPLVRAGAAVASLGALLALLAGVGRTSLAMARNRDLPAWLSGVHPRHRVPARAQVTVGAAVAVLVLTTDLRGVIGFSSFGVLLYYAIANVSAFTQDAEHRRWPRWMNLAGVAGCLLLVVTLPVEALITGGALLVIGLSGRLIVVRAR